MKNKIFWSDGALNKHWTFCPELKAVCPVNTTTAHHRAHTILKVEIGGGSIMLLGGTSWRKDEATYRENLLQSPYDLKHGQHLTIQYNSDPKLTTRQYWSVLRTSSRVSTRRKPYRTSVKRLEVGSSCFSSNMTSEDLPGHCPAGWRL